VLLGGVQEVLLAELKWMNDALEAEADGAPRQVPEAGGERQQRRGVARRPRGGPWRGTRGSSGSTLWCCCSSRP